MQKKTILILAGLLLFVFGITSIVLTLIGANWSILDVLESGGRLLSFVLKIIMAMVGILLLFFSQVNWEREHRESSK